MIINKIDSSVNFAHNSSKVPTNLHCTPIRASTIVHSCHCLLAPNRRFFAMRPKTFGAQQATRGSLLRAQKVVNPLRGIDFAESRRAGRQTHIMTAVRQRQTFSILSGGQPQSAAHTHRRQPLPERAGAHTQGARRRRVDLACTRDSPWVQ